MTGTTYFYDQATNFLFEGKDNNCESEYLEVRYTVYGSILISETKSVLRVSYAFENLEKANSYVDKMIEIFPISTFKIDKETRQQCRYRG